MRRYVSELAWMGEEMDNNDGDDDDGDDDDDDDDDDLFSNIKYDDMQYIQIRSVAQKEMLRYLRSPKWKLLNDIQQAEVHSQGQDDVDASE